VIKIIRTEDEPKPVLCKKFSLTDNQAEAILNMRLRQLRKLEEMEIRGEEKELKAERAELKSLLADENARWQKIDAELVELKKLFAPNTPLGRRRTLIEGAPADVQIPITSVIEREPITIVCSEKGWIRAQKGHVDAAMRAAIKYKEGDGEKFVLPAQTTDKILLFAGNGRFYTLAADKLPSGRGFGEPVKLLLELPPTAEVLGVFVYEDTQKFVVASRDARGFVVPASELLAQTRNGKQVLNVADDNGAAAAVPLAGDHIAVIGSNRKLLVFPASELPEMARGKGVALQKYQQGVLSDITTFNLKSGLTWFAGGRTRTEADMRSWLGARAAAGRLAPNGFNRSNRFAG
jgi:topoisomerase-4 subunit A